MSVVKLLIVGSSWVCFVIRLGGHGTKDDIVGVYKRIFLVITFRMTNDVTDCVLSTFEMIFFSLLDTGYGRLDKVCQTLEFENLKSFLVTKS